MDRLVVVSHPVPINILSRRGLIGNECCDTRSLICLLPAALFWYWQPAAVAQSIFGSLRRPALQYACTRHNGKSTPSVTNQSPRRMKMECAFMLCTIHLPRFGGATSPGQMQRIVTRSFGLLVWPEVSSPDIADSASPPRFHPRYCLARKPRKSPSTL